MLNTVIVRRPATVLSYRGEGNSSLVLASLSEENFIYRLKKISIRKKFEEDVDETEFTKLELINQVTFVKNVMKPWIGPSYLVPMELVELPYSDLQSELMPRRPGHRLANSLTGGYTLAIEMPDLCYIPQEVSSIQNESADVYLLSSRTNSTISIELKPKWGFLPATTSNLTPSDPRVSVCRFCMHQYLKVKLGTWLKHSCYCPIDLFSGCSARMKFALKKLIDSPQNNFRLFKDGQLICGDNVNCDINSELSTIFEEIPPAVEGVHSHTASLLDLAVQCLLHEDEYTSSLGLPVFKPQACYESTVAEEHTCTKDCPGLPANSILSRLLAVQMLSDLCLSDVLTLHGHVQHHVIRYNGERENLRFDGPYADDWLQITSSNSDVYLDTAVLQIKKFLISRSAKDCSIIISARRLTQQSGDQCNSTDVPARHFIVTIPSGERFICCVTAIDLDPKQFNKIPFYHEEDESVVKHYVENVVRNFNMTTF